MEQALYFIRRSSDKLEIYPLLALLGGTLTGGVFTMVHQARAPDVVWNHKTNAEPWQHVKEGERVKLAAYNQKYDGKYIRKEW